MPEKILLIEAEYKNKYPPMGLMKIAKYHIDKGDEVLFIKGREKTENFEPDRIYITTLFTFYWNKTLKTIKYYLRKYSCNIYVGGILSSLMARDVLDELKNDSRVHIVNGLLTNSNIVGYEDDVNIDRLIPDYSILNQIDYEYKHSNDYYIFLSRGCVRKCEFCVVPKLEPELRILNDLEKTVESIDKAYGKKRNMIIMDNNFLALPIDYIRKTIDTLVKLGYGKENNYLYTSESGMYKRKVRKYVDFNQGVDARLLSEKKMEILSKISIRPLRIAFDYATPSFIKLYKSKVRLAYQYGITNLSNYILYNFNDKIDDFYNRAEINILLNTEMDIKIFSFPMRYSPIVGPNSKNRKYIGKHWSKKEIRGVQCILVATRGLISPNEEFFRHAFGQDVSEFKLLILAPERYIINRKQNKDNYQEWKDEITSLKEAQFNEVVSFIRLNNYKNIDENLFEKYETVLRHYL